MFTAGEERIALVTDASCGLTDEMFTRFDVHAAWLRAAARGALFRPFSDMTDEETQALCSAGDADALPPRPEDVSALYQRLYDEGATRILHLTTTSGLSGTHGLVCALAAQSPVPVDVVDSKTAACGLGLLVLEAAAMLSLGSCAADVIAHLTEMRSHQLTAFVLPSLKILRRSGRAGAVKRSLPTPLGLHPVITLSPEGTLSALKKVKARSFDGALTAMKEEFFHRYDGHRVHIAIMHNGDEEHALQLLEDFRKRLQVDTELLCPLHPSLAIHTGPGLLGASVLLAE